MAGASVIERTARRFSGERSTARVAQVRVEAKQEQVAGLPESLQSIINEAASRGSSRVFDNLSRYSPEQLAAAAKVADLFVNGGFVALPVFPRRNGIEGGKRYRDATIIPMTDEARANIGTLPDGPAQIGPFSHEGDKDTTGPKREELAAVGIREENLPVIPYEKVTHDPSYEHSGRTVGGHKNNEIFEYHIFYIPPGTQRELTPEGTFRGTPQEESSEINSAIYRAIGRELAGKEIDSIRDREQPVLAIRKPSIGDAAGYVAELSIVASDKAANAAIRNATNAILESEETLARRAIAAVFVDAAAISKRFLFPRGKRRG